MKDLSTVQLEVSKEHLMFDFEAFMLEKGASDGAVVLITPNQFIMTDCFVRMGFDLSYWDHGTAIDTIYSAIYKEHEKVTGTYNRMWQEQVMQEGNIAIQLCSGYAPNVLSIPEVISESQYVALELFNNKIKETYEMNREYFDVHPMKFFSFNDGSSVNNIDSILNSLKVGQGYYKFEEETIIGNDIRELNNDMYESKGNAK